jgi:hypothetical protein
VTHFNIYRKRAQVTTRIDQIPIQAQYTDLTGQTGDIYYYTFFDSIRFSESGPSPFILAADSLIAVTVTGFIVGIDGAPAGFQTNSQGVVTGVDVEVSLTNLSTSMPIADGQLIASLEQTATTDDTGTFVLPIVPNDLIFPGNTFYKFEYLDKRFFKYVRSTDGQAQLFANLLDVPPKELR